MQDELYALNNDLKQILANHNKVMIDMKTLLKSMNKVLSCSLFLFDEFLGKL
jgi:hypothetical protein